MYSKKKILIVGDWAYDIYQKAIYDAFLQAGFDVGKFDYGKCFRYANHPSLRNEKLSFLQSVYYKLQYKYTFGPTVNNFNHKLIEEAFQYDIIFLYTCRHIYGKTLNKIKKNKPHIIICSYNNDNPFSCSYSKYVWRNFKQTLRYSDKIFAFRNSDILEYKKRGLNAHLLRAYYRKEFNFPITNIEYKYDVVFIGHFEDDDRDIYIREIIQQGLNVQVFGTNWEKSKYYILFTKYMDKIVPKYGRDYNRILNESKIALVFLSKKNIDTYTRRNFEIPAAKVFMLSEYSDDLCQNLFKEGVECDYFRELEDFIHKIKYYLENEDLRETIAANGYLRNMSNEVNERVNEVIKILCE